METINIEDVFFPENGELKINEEGTAYAEIVDAELDPVECKFNNDGCVEIETKGYTYITLTKENLQQLIDLIDEAEDHYMGLED
jgi:hypothetical protein